MAITFQNPSTLQPEFDPLKGALTEVKGYVEAYATEYTADSVERQHNAHQLKHFTLDSLIRASVLASEHEKYLSLESVPEQDAQLPLSRFEPGTLIGIPAVAITGAKLILPASFRIESVELLDPTARGNQIFIGSKGNGFFNLTGIARAFELGFDIKANEGSSNPIVLDDVLANGHKHWTTYNPV